MLRQLMMFGLAGGAATSLHYALLIALVQAGIGPVIASTVGAVAGALINYGLNRRYTFRSRRRHAEALPRYLITASGGMAINAAVLALLLFIPVHYLAAQVAATGVVLVWNFFVNRWWTFRGAGYAQ